MQDSNEPEPTEATRAEKRKALLSILGNGLYLLVVGGLTLAFAVGILSRGAEGVAGLAGLLVTLAILVGVIALGVRIGTRRR